MSRLRVLHLFDSLRPSGMEQMLVSAAKSFSTCHIECLVVGQGENHPFAEALKAAGYDVASVPSVLTPRGFRDFRRLIRRYRPDVVHLHAEHSYAAAVLATRFAFRVPVVRTIHSYFLPTTRKRWIRRFERAVVDRKVFALIACSPDVAENEKRYGRRPDVVLNWIDDRFLELRATVKGDRESTCILIVGNCSGIKRHSLVLEAAAELEMPVVHLGNEDSAPAVELSLLSRLEGLGLLRHRGVADPSEWMKIDPVFAMSSSREGMSVSLAEALAAGLRAVVADSPGLQWARDFESATFVPDDESWAEAIGTARVTGDVRVHEHRAEIFRAERGAREYAAIYERASRGANPRVDARRSV